MEKGFNAFCRETATMERGKPIGARCRSEVSKKSVLGIGGKTSIEALLFIIECRVGLSVRWSTVCTNVSVSQCSAAQAFSWIQCETDLEGCRAAHLSHNKELWWGSTPSASNLPTVVTNTIDTVTDSVSDHVY